MAAFVTMSFAVETLPAAVLIFSVTGVPSETAPHGLRICVLQLSWTTLSARMLPSSAMMRLCGAS